MSVLHGNIQGLKPGQLDSLKRLYKRKFTPTIAWSQEQARELALLSAAIKRQIGLLIDRKGKVCLVIVGDAASILIPELPPASGAKLRGLRLVHTHLGDCGLSREDLLDMLFLRLDAVIALGVDESGEPLDWQAAWLNPSIRNPEDKFIIQEARPWFENQFDLPAITELFETEPGKSGARTDPDGRALLVSVSAAPVQTQEENLDELAELARTAGLEVCGRLVQRVAQPNPRFILGKGKLAELEVAALDGNANILIFDGELTPAQLHNLADATERKVLDRTQLILDIFAQHAASRAGKLQVELAQLAYAQPRLAGKNKALDRLMGGLGGRGPGETRLELDRRKSRQRMAFLRKQLELLRRQRGQVRNRRNRNGIPVVALVGYTNAGKSTLLNKLTDSEVLAQERMFATLDTTTRRVRFPEEREIILSDTVGFIRNLPAELMEAFQATLEELDSADLLIHVADASHPGVARQIESVENILESLNLQNLPKILVLNKTDKAGADALDTLLAEFPAAIPVSALTGEGFDRLLARIGQNLFIKSLGKETKKADEI